MRTNIVSQHARPVNSFHRILGYFANHPYTIYHMYQVPGISTLVQLNKSTQFSLHHARKMLSGFLVFNADTGRIRTVESRTVFDADDFKLTLSDGCHTI